MKPLDVLIIGGGPAGLTAALYLARFRRDVAVVDNRASRCALIPQSHNYPGVPHGISGAEVLNDLREQVALYKAQQVEGTITKLERDGNDFIARINGNADIRARKVILATGIVDEKPNLPRMQEFIYKGAVRFCPICDGYEAMDQRIGVIGPIRTAIKKALFLRTWSKQLTILSLDQTTLTPEEDALLKDAGIDAPAPVKDLYIDGDRVAADLTDGRTLNFDILYPAMGAQTRSQLAVDLGANHMESGCICTNDYHESSIPGLYAIGDISTELHQISVSYGHAAIAATHAHNQLPANNK